MDFVLSDPLFSFNVLHDLLNKRSIADLTSILEVKDQILSRLCIKLFNHGDDHTLNLSLKERRVYISDAKRHASFDEVRHELFAIDLVFVFDESRQLFLKLRLQRLVPKLVRDVPGDRSVGKKHGDLSELLHIVVPHIAHHLDVERVAKIAHVCDLRLI